jgi:hypothetical protein
MKSGRRLPTPAIAVESTPTFVMGREMASGGSPRSFIERARDESKGVPAHAAGADN